jgi:formyltetrahydrofolate deformylase
MASVSETQAILLVHGPDRKGIVAAFSQTLFGHGCGIVSSEQHTDQESSIFYQRIVFDAAELHTDRVSLERGIDEVASRLGMTCEVRWPKPKRVAIFVSKYAHCLWELLLRHDAGELPGVEIVQIVSNHEDLRHVAEHFSVPYAVFKVTKDTKRAVEDRELALLKDKQVDLVVLARYMQIITDEFCAAYPCRVINIHHSFLPAFIGSKPYHRAHARGVKLVGATAHYATADLDEGPIIEQDCARISHKNSIDDLLRKGRVLEKNVLVTAVRAHVEDRIIVYESKCVVFGE